jgi:hypothetical protein
MTIYDEEVERQMEFQILSDVSAYSGEAVS